MLETIVFKISPIGLISPEMPLLDDLTIGMPSSMDLNCACTKCCLGPLTLPNQPSLLILTNKFVFFDILLRTKVGKIMGERLLTLRTRRGRGPFMKMSHSFNAVYLFAEEDPQSGRRSRMHGRLENSLFKFERRQSARTTCRKPK